MVNETVLKYLRENKDKYPLEKLKAEIISKHYSEDEYYEALKIISESKFKEGEVSRLPNTNVVSEKKEKEISWVTLFIIIMLILMFEIGLIVLFNYLGYDFFGFNFFG